MTVELPKAVEDMLQAEVDSGRFASLDAAIFAAIQLLLEERRTMPSKTGPAPFIGHEDIADGREEVAEDAMTRRREEAGRSDVRRVIRELKEFSRGNTLGEGLSIREMIEEGRRY